MPDASGEQPITVPVVDASASDPVIASTIFGLQVGESAQRGRIDELAEIVERLRADSTSGWQARQSDATGYAAEVFGGRIPTQGTALQAAQSFMDRYGALFGPASGLVFQESGYDEEEYVTVRVEQFVGEVPVDGALLMFSVRLRGASSEVQYVEGRLVDTTGVDENPTITAQQAEAIVSSALGVSASPGAVLTVTTDQGLARLAWVVSVENGPEDTSDSVLGLGVEYPALVFVDAQDGSVISYRRSATNPSGRAPVPSESSPGGASGVDYGNYAFEIPEGGRPVRIETDYLGKIPIAVNAEQLPDGSIVLVDLTGQGADRRTKKGAIVALDGSGLTGQEGNMVGSASLVRYPSVDAIPKDALYAMWGARETLDYLKDELGMLSFDGFNSPVPIVYNFTYGDSCLDNAFFLTAPGLSHMAVGVPCPDASGNRIATVADIDTIAHEIGHGVTHSHTFTRNTIQQGALDEGLADYLGLILRNGVFGEASPVSSADICLDYPGDHPWCSRWRDGVGIRSVNTGATFNDYAFTIEDGLYGTAADLYSDSGHINSMVWTNALWQARRAVASVDGGDMASSQRVKAFDRSVIRAATRLTPGTGFIEAAEAVVRAATEVGMTPDELNLIRDRFRANGLCRDCGVIMKSGEVVTPVSVSTSIKSHPVALRDQVAYLLTTPDSSPGGVVATPGSPQQQRLGPPADLTVHIAGSGSTVLQAQAIFSADGTQENYSIGVADAASGEYSVLARDVDVLVAPAASESAYVWVDGFGNVVYQPVAGGAAKTFAAGGPIAHVATSGDRVAILMGDGRLRAWNAATNAVRDLAIYDPSPLESFRSQEFLLPVGSLAMHGDRIAVAASSIAPGLVQVFDLAASTKTTFSSNAFPLGVAVNDRFVVWVENRGPQASPIFGEDADAFAFPDTELRGFAFGPQRYYRMVNQRGQQAFPSLSEELLAWQETGNGNSDIYSVRVAPQ